MREAEAWEPPPLPLRELDPALLVGAATFSPKLVLNVCGEAEGAKPEAGEPRSLLRGACSEEMFTQHLLARVSSAGCSVNVFFTHTRVIPGSEELTAPAAAHSVRKHLEGENVVLTELRSFQKEEAFPSSRPGNRLNQSWNRSESAEVLSGRFRSSSIST